VHIQDSRGEIERLLGRRKKMRKLFAIGTLLLSSAAVFAAPAAAYDRDDYNNHARIEEKARFEKARFDTRRRDDRRERDAREWRYEQTHWDRR
jgi:hypothetical protein